MSPVSILLGILLLTAAPTVGTAGAPTRSVALALIREGRLPEARPVLEELSRLDPGDPVAAYWAARAEESAGDEDEARCRYLGLEGSFPGSDASLLALRRRFDLERRQADALVAFGSDWEETEGGGQGAVERLLLLPPENLGTAAAGSEFSLIWTYDLFDRLRGSGLCPASLPSLFAVLDLLHEGSAVRASALVASHPVNTVEGLRGRLAALRSSSGSPYLETPLGGWTDDLEEALLRYQKDRGLPPTGEADPGTQARLDAELASWLLTPPPPLDPKLVPRAAHLLGATHVLRGTYRVEGSRVSLLVTLLDPDGLSSTGEPISRDFLLGDLDRACADLARDLVETLARHEGRTPARPGHASPENPLSIGEMSAASASLLLQDRGMPQLARHRWERAPSSWFGWPLLAETERALGASDDDAARLEEGLLYRWGRVPDLDPSTAMNALLGNLGQPGLGNSPLGAAEPGVFRVLGTDGILRIHGERP